MLQHRQVFLGRRSTDRDCQIYCNGTLSGAHCNLTSFLIYPTDDFEDFMVETLGKDTKIPVRVTWLHLMSCNLV